MSKCVPIQLCSCAHLSVKVRDVCGYVSVCVCIDMRECFCPGYEKSAYAEEEDEIFHVITCIW